MQLEAIAQHLVNQLRLSVTSETDQLLVLNYALGLVSTTTHIQKIHGGGLPELVACKAIKLRWENVNARGADAYNAQGQRVELKTFALKSTSKSCNVNYDFPKENAQQHFATDKNYAGGHYFVAMNARKTEVLWWVYLTQARFAEVAGVQERKNPGSAKVNLGSTLCSVCKQCPRLEALIDGRAHACPGVRYKFT